MAKFIKIAEVDDVPRVSGKKIRVNGKSIALFKHKNNIYAIRNSCPHQGADLADGHISESKVVCPLHRWKFNFEDGAFTGNENIRIPTYQTKVKNNDVYILWDEE